MNVDFSKCQAQTDAYRALKPGNTITLAFGRGVGKSTIQRLFWYLLIAQWDGQYRPGSGDRGVRIVMLMPTLKQANRTHADKYYGELARNGAWGFLGGVVNKTTMKASFPGGSSIQWVSAENANDNRGIRCDVVSIDEADDIDREIYNGIVLPWLSEPHSLKIRVLGGTPRRGRFGLLWAGYRTLPEARPDKFFSFHATAYDAPLLVDPDIVEEAKATTPHATFEREWMCNFDAAEGLVYPMFSEAIHVVEPPKEFNRILVGLDHGYQDPAVFIVIGIVGSGKDAKAYCIYEYCQSLKVQDELADVAEEIDARWPMAEWYGDSSGAQDHEAYKRRIRKHITAATHRKEEGVGTVATMLSPRIDNMGRLTPRLFVSKVCTNLINEMGCYRRKRDPRNKEIILDDIADGNDHCQDATRYPLYKVFGDVYSTKFVIEDGEYEDDEENEYA